MLMRGLNNVYGYTFIMMPTTYEQPITRRVRAILITPRNTLMLIKRLKPEREHEPYWVAPGGGVEGNESLDQALLRELAEELGAQVNIMGVGFVLEHEKVGKRLEEHFFVCELLNYDLSQRDGPEFADPTRGEYLPDEIPLEPQALDSIHFRTPELREWLLDNLDLLRAA